MNNNCNFPLKYYSRFGSLSLMAILLLVFTVNNGSLFIQAEKADGKYVYDYAKVLSNNEIEALDNKSKVIGDKYDSDLYIITDTSSEGLSMNRYASDFADLMEVENACVLFVNLDPDDRGVAIQRYGSNDNLMESWESDDILDSMIPDLRAGDYYNAFVIFLDKADTYLKDAPTSDNDNSGTGSISGNPDDHRPAGNTDSTDSDKLISSDLLSHILPSILISLGVGAAAVGFMAYSAGGRVSVNNRTYLDANHSSVTGSRDVYIRTTTTKTKRQDNTNNNNSNGSSGSSGSSSGTSSGGRSYSSTSRKF